MRKKMSDGRFGATPHKNDEMVKRVTDIINSRLRPNVAASQPVIGRMIALATRYDVSTHVASSIVADIVAAMCGSDTFTTVVSSTSMKVPNITAIATIHGLMWRCSVMADLPCIYLSGHRHTRPQQLFCVLLLVDGDANGDTLNHLHEVPCRVLGRQQAEARSRRGGEALDVPLEIAAAVGVDLDDGRLPGAHVFQLRLLEIRGDPDVFERDHGHEWLARLNHLTDLHGLFADDAAHRRADSRVLEIQLCLLNGRALLHDARVR